MSAPLDDPLAPLRPFLRRGDPFPLAWILKTEVLEASDAEKQADGLLRLAFETLRYAALVAASDYAAAPVVEAQVSRPLEALARPLDSAFVAFLRAAVPVLARHDHLFVPEFVATLEQAERRRVRVLRMGEERLEESEPRPLLGAFVEMRNAKVHGRFAGLWPQFVAHNAPLVGALLEAFAWVSRYGLMRLVGPDRWIRLAGPAPLFDAAPIPAATLQALATATGGGEFSGLCLVSPEGDRVRMLDPFVIWADCPFCERRALPALGHEVFVFNGDTGKRTTYVGMVHARVLSQPWMRVMQILRAKYVPEPPLAARTLSVDDLYRRAARQSTATLAEAVAGQRYLPALYHPRVEMQGEIARWLGGDRVALLLLGEAGSGKTTLLCHLVESERGETILLYQGHQLRPDEPLEARILRDLNLADGWPALLECLTRQQRRLVIVVDGVNESEGAAALLRELCGFAARHAVEAAGPSSPVVKLLLSVRGTSFRRALAALTAGGGSEAALFSEAVFHHRDEVAPGPGPRRTYRMVLGPLGPAEVEALYETYRAAAPELDPSGVRRGRRPLTPFASLTPQVRSVLAHPWYLRLALEAYDGRAIPAEVWSGAILERFCAMRLTGGTAEEAERFAGRAALLDELIALMRRHRTSTFERDDLQDLSPRWSRALLAPYPTQSVYAQLVDEGVLVESAETDRTGQWPRTRYVVRVAFDALLEYLLADAVQRAAGGPTHLTAAVLAACLEEGRTFEAMAGAAEVLLAGAARAGRADLLRETLEAAAPEVAAAACLRVALALQPVGGSAFESVLDAVATTARPGAAATLLNEMAVAFLDQRRFEAALACTRRVVRLLPSPAAGDIEAMHTLAVALTNQGLAETSLRQLGPATESYQQAGRLWGRLVEDEGRAEYRSDLARVIMQCGSHLVMSGALEVALTMYDQAVAHARRAAQSAGHVGDLQMIGLAVLNRGLLLDRLHRSERAAEDLELATRMLRVGVRDDLPGDWARPLGSALSGLSSALAARGRADEALAAAEEGVSIQRGLVDGGRIALGDDLAGALRTLALHLDAAGRHAEALAGLDEAIEIVRRLLAAGRLELRAELGRCLTNRASTLRALGRHREALVDAEEAVGLHRALWTGGGAPGEPGLSGALHNRGNVLYELGQLDEAYRSHTESIAVARYLVEQRGRTDLVGELEQGLETRWRAQVNGQRWAQALPALDEALAWHEARAGGEGAAVAVLVRVLRHRMLARLELGEPAAAEADLVRALGLLDPLYAPDRPQPPEAVTREVVYLLRALRALPPSRHAEMEAHLSPPSVAALRQLLTES